jgi:tRNA(Ile)-lysidine synthase
VKKAWPIWQRRALKLGELLRAESLEQSAIAGILSRAANERIAIACSGGADSVALVLALWAHFPARRGRWLILHFNHKLRGRSAGVDARFVATLARSLGEKFVVGSWDRPKSASGKVSEAESRAARHAFFYREMKKARSRAIVLGHQRDDIVESMLMRLSRGSGAGGLAAPRPVQQAGGGIVRMRPLLTIGRADLRAALKEVGAVWREDASNKTDDYFRNRVRRKVVPRLKEASPQNVFVGFAASRTQLQEDDDALESLVTERVGQPESGQPFDLSSLVSQSGALVRRAVQRWLLAEDLARFLSRAAVTEVIEAVRRSEAQQISAGNGQFIRTKNGCLWVERGRDARSGRRRKEGRAGGRRSRRAHDNPRRPALQSRPARVLLCARLSRLVCQQLDVHRGDGGRLVCHRIAPVWPCVARGAWRKQRLKLMRAAHR